MGAAGGINAAVREAESLDGLTADEVTFNNFPDVSFGDVSVPGGFRVNDHDGSVFTLVEASCLVCSDFCFDAVFGYGLFEFQLKDAKSIRVTTAAFIVSRALVSADEDVMLINRH